MKEDMNDIRLAVGKRIRQFRKGRDMTLEELAETIHKSKATLSKYERGEIPPDLDTLYYLADALNVKAEQLLYTSDSEITEERLIDPAFFKGLKTFYAYYYDGRNGKVSRCVLEVYDRIGENRYKIAMYMTCPDLENYERAENIYWGYIEHFDSLSLIEVTNRDTPTEKGSIQILASFLDAPTKWGLWNGVSSRPLMPVAVKMLFSKKPLKEDAELKKQLMVNKEDIRRLKYYNMFSVM